MHNTDYTKKRNRLTMKPVDQRIKYAKRVAMPMVLAFDPDVRVRMALADTVRRACRHYYVLAKDEDPAVRKVFVKNHIRLNDFVNDKDPEIRNLARKKLGWVIYT